MHRVIKGGKLDVKAFLKHRRKEEREEEQAVNLARTVRKLPRFPSRAEREVQRPAARTRPPGKRRGAIDLMGVIDDLQLI